MNSQILCNWLGTLAWPPDHYALLGLKPEEADSARIEQHCQERMAKLRCFQLSYPEEATEGMNRVAQAFITLTEALVSPQRTEPAGNGTATNETASAATADTKQLLPAGNKTEIDWKNTPPPVRLVRDVAGSQESTAAWVKPAVPPATGPPTAQPIDTAFELAQESPEARRGLGTLPALIERINQTRRFILAWNQAGKYLSNSKKKLARPLEDVDLTRRLNKVFELTADFPKILGNPGQPGYRVVAMARLEMTAQMFKMLDKSQRLDLARDWESGYRVLLTHRRFLHTEFKTLRRRGPFQLVLQAVRSAINDHPVWVSTGVLLATGVCALIYWKIF